MVMTETAVRAALANADLASTTEFRVPAGTVVTPSARAWLVDQRIDLVVGDKRVSNLPQPGPAAPAVEERPQRPAWKPPGAGSGASKLERFRAEQGLSGHGADGDPSGVGESGQAMPPSAVAGLPGGGQSGAGPEAGLKSALPAFTKPELWDLPDGTQAAEKPEHLTALVGNALVEKDHPNIRLRGLLDDLDAHVIATQVRFRALGLEAAVADLAEVLGELKQLMRAEVLGVRLDQTKLLGMDEAEIRRLSHDPEPTFGRPHFMASVDDGEAVAALNLLRTKVRQVELAAYDAFKRPGQEPRRMDILQALNRLSSLFYIMMFRAASGGYGR
ncbi:MAG: hypothetical protein LBR32_00095 [Propionibacteriaceae bacterium]|jgi:ethanolamine utilization cobalamin adenosyltransferase|nr:hypothetical protein [Propionibacteriaceae bacterium]